MVNRCTLLPAGCVALLSAHERLRGEDGVATDVGHSKGSHTTSLSDTNNATLHVLHIDRIKLHRGLSEMLVPHTNMS